MFTLIYFNRSQHAFWFLGNFNGSERTSAKTTAHLHSLQGIKGTILDSLLSDPFIFVTVILLPNEPYPLHVGAMDYWNVCFTYIKNTFGTVIYFKGNKNTYNASSILHQEKMGNICSTYESESPRIAPITTFDTPMPIIWMDVAIPIAVPTVAWETTSGMEGHKLACVWTNMKKKL